jgi:opacity protein-like surface antigen
MQKANLLKFSAIALLSVVLMAPQIAKSDNHAESPWFAELKYQKSIDEDAGWKDHDTASTKVVSTVGEEWDGIDSYGFAFGYTLENGNTNLSLGYENFGTSKWKATSFTNQAGSSFNNLISPMKMTNIMLELSQNYPMGDKWFLTALAGVGQSTIKTERYTVAGTAYGTGIETNHTSTRFGAGAGYQLSEKAKIIAMVQRSDYGKSEVKSTEGTMFEVEAVATEVGIRLRVSF